jgi:hypothetical protein
MYPKPIDPSVVFEGADVEAEPATPTPGKVMSLMTPVFNRAIAGRRLYGLALNCATDQAKALSKVPSI